MLKNTISLLYLIGLWLYSFAGFAQHTITQIDTSYANIKKVEIKGGFCRVEVGAIANDGKVSFFGEISSGKKIKNNLVYRFKHVVTGNVLKVWLEGSTIRKSFISQSRLMFKVPPKTSVVVNNRSGSIYAFGLRGDLAYLQTRSGSIRGEYIGASRIHLGSRSGSIRVESLVSDQIDIKNFSGETRITDVDAKIITGNSHSGSQRWLNIKGKLVSETHSATIRVIGGKGKVDLKNHIGTIRVYDFVGKVQARNSSGYLRLKNVHGALNLSTLSGSIVGDGILFMGASNLSSSSGYIKISMKNDPDKIGFDLRANSSDIKINEYNYGKRATLRKNNPIMVNAATQSGSQRYEEYEEEK